MPSHERGYNEIEGRKKEGENKLENLIKSRLFIENFCSGYLRLGEGIR